MARIRRVSDVLTFTPPTFLEGIAQIVDLEGRVPSHVQPPRIKYVERKSSTKAKCSGGYQVKSVNSALSRDVKVVGSDMRACIERYGKKVR
jgi:hypothetical protein